MLDAADVPIPSMLIAGLLSDGFDGGALYDDAERHIFPECDEQLAC